jgi:hypothetical protein
MFEDIRRGFSNIPEEVVRLWIEPLAQNNGWPVTDGWDRRITGEDFTFWNDATWEKLEVNLAEVQYSPGHNGMIRGLFEAYIQGIENNYWRLLGEDGKRRFRRARDFIIRNEVFPQPPILMIDELERYEALDGNHRFLGYIIAYRTHEQFLASSPEDQSAFLASINQETFSPPRDIQEVWICKPNWANSERVQTRNYLRQFGMEF